MRREQEKLYIEELGWQIKARDEYIDYLSEELENVNTPLEIEKITYLMRMEYEAIKHTGAEISVRKERMYYEDVLTYSNKEIQFCKEELGMQLTEGQRAEFAIRLRVWEREKNAAETILRRLHERMKRFATHNQAV